VQIPPGSAAGGSPGNRFGEYRGHLVRVGQMGRMAGATRQASTPLGRRHPPAYRDLRSPTSVNPHLPAGI